MVKSKDEENPSQTAGTVAGRVATIRPQQTEDNKASPGAAKDQEILASDKEINKES